MPWASNATFLVTVRCGDAEQRAIYKPVRGERPLWDFEPGLHRRELAAFVLSEKLGFGVVPPTVVARRPVRRGLAAVVRRRRPHGALLHDLRAPTRRPRSAALDRRARSHRQQHRPQERALPARRRPRVGDRQRVVLRGAVQAAHGDLGVRRRNDRRPGAVARRQRSPTSVPLELATLLDDDEVDGVAVPGDQARDGAPRSPPTRVAIATRGRSSDLERVFRSGTGGLRSASGGPCGRRRRCRGRRRRRSAPPRPC